jgi:hypothetical protein
MKKILIFILFCLMKNSAFAGDQSGDLIAIVFNQTIGYQIGYSSSQHPVMQAFDYNGLFGAFLNGGYNYQSNIGSKAFLGVGLSEFLQIQYGYAFRSNNPIIRLRSDWPLFIKIDYLECSTIGIFAERQFGNNTTSGYNFGISLSISIFDIIRTYPRYQDYRRHQDRLKKLNQLEKNKVYDNNNKKIL